MTGFCTGRPPVEIHMRHMQRIIQEFQVKFPVRGKFEFRQGQRIRDIVHNAEVPEKYGVYIISDPQGRVLYIGRSGTMLNNGRFQRQTLRGRLTNRQGGRSRQEFFGDMLRERDVQSLHFEWFVTFSEANRVLPSLTESQLLQAYFDDQRRLPPYNEKA